MNQNNLAKYVELEERFKALEQEKQELRAVILDDLRQNNLDKIESEVFGSFTVAHKTSWKYSPAIVKLEEKVKIAKDKEQKKGVAKPVVTDYLLYKPHEN